jgi:transcriptional regulator with XRE-family HTH domain
MMTRVDMTGEEIRRWREERGIDRYELARLLGLDKMTVYRWEAGLRTPNERLMELALKGLECELLARSDHGQG